MPPKSVKLNGGAASHVASADDFSYADLDLIFPMEVENSDSFDKVSRGDNSSTSIAPSFFRWFSLLLPT